MLEPWNSSKEGGAGKEGVVGAIFHTPQVLLFCGDWRWHIFVIGSGRSSLQTWFD